MRGDVVVVPFPFSDLSHAKRRPALVVAAPGGDDVILCQITSRQVRDGLAVALDDTDFEEGKLRVPSNVRPNRIFTADRRIILYEAGRLRQDKTNQVIKAIVRLFEGEASHP